MQTTSEILDLSSSSLSLEKIVSRFRELEEQIQTKTLVDVIESISKTFYTQNQVIIDDQIYMIVPDFSFPARRFTLHITPAERSKSKIISETIRISTIGSVSKITIKYPAELHREAAKCLALMKDTFVKQYAHIEAVFLEAYGALQNSLFDGLESILAKEFSANPPTAYLSITSIDSQKYSFHLGYDQIRRVLHKLEKMRDLPVSPLDAVLAFLFEELTDSFLRTGMLSTKKFNTLSFKKIHSIEGVRLTSQVQNFLMGTDLSVLEVSRVGDFSLQINCAPRDRDYFQKIISLVSDEMCARLQRNIYSYSKRKTKFTSAWCRRETKDDSKWQSAKKVAIEIIPKIIAEIVGKIVGLP